MKQKKKIFRHGDRSPYGLYPNDPHKDFKWPGGPGTLSPKGGLQLMDLGKIMRKRFNSLIREDRLEDVMSITSSSSIRSLMSAKSFLNGFNSSNESCQNNIIVIKSIPAEKDNVKLFLFLIESFERNKFFFRWLRNK